MILSFLTKVILIEVELLYLLIGISIFYNLKNNNIISYIIN